LPPSPLKLQLEAAKAILNRGGFAERPAQDTDSNKEVQDLSRDELFELAASIRSRLADIATPVNAEQKEDDDA
jgi:hypothetical protein